MHKLRSACVRFMNFFRRSRFQEDMREQVEAHIRMIADDLIAHGADPRDAEIEARRAMGNELLVRELAHDEASIGVLSRLYSLWEDLRYAVRLLLKNPGYAIAALLTLAIGIGANATVFSVVNGVLLRPLPFEEPDRIANISSQNGHGDLVYVKIGVDKLQAVSRSFEYTASQVSFTAVSKSDAPSVDISAVSPDFLKLFKIRPQIGRDFSSEDMKPDATAVAIISHEYWQSQFGGDPNVLGKVLTIPPGIQLTVIGVLPGSVRAVNDLSSPESVWTLQQFVKDGARGYGARIWGRLKPGVTASQAQAELTPMWDRVVEPGGEMVSNPRPLVQTMLDHLVGSSRITILTFEFAVLAVLLIVIVNLVGLELARLPVLENELSIRSALGASRWQLMQLMMTKTMLLGVAGGAFGLIAAWVLQQVVVGTLPWFFPRKADIHIDSAVLIAGFALSILTSILVGIIPAIRAARPNTREMMHAAAAHYTSSRRSRLFQDALTVCETAVAVILVVAAGLLINNLWQVLRHDLGFEPDGLSSIRISLPPSYPAEQQAVFFADLLKRLKPMSNVESIALASDAPIDGGHFSFAAALDGEQSGQERPIQLQGIGGEYFSTLHIPVLAGRTFTEEEIRRADPVAIISATSATKLFRGKSPLGQRFLNKGDTLPVTVVGVVGDVQYNFYQNIGNYGVDMSQSMTWVTDRATAYTPVTAMRKRFSFYQRSAVVLARTRSGPRDLAAVIAELEPKATLKSDTLGDFIATSTAQQRLQTLVLSCFGFIALLLAALGIYSVVAHSVVRRTKEIGIRMALGARASEVFAEVCRQALVPSVIGMFIGFAVSIAIRRVLTSYLSAIASDDAPTYLVVTIVMFLVVLLACSIPARRATKLDPVSALRCE